MWAMKDRIFNWRMKEGRFDVDPSTGQHEWIPPEFTMWSKQETCDLDQEGWELPLILLANSLGTQEDIEGEKEDEGMYDQETLDRILRDLDLLADLSWAGKMN